MERFFIGEKNGVTLVHFPDFLVGKNSDVLTSTINTDDDGREFFYVPNFKHPDKHFRFIRGSIKDMYHSILEGNGDTLLSINPMGGYNIFSHTKVIYYTDRVYGEKIRSIFLKSFEKVTFGYLFSLHHNASFSSPAIYDKNGEDVSSLRKTRISYMYTLEEAELCRQKIIDRVTKGHVDYDSWCSTTPRDIVSQMWENGEVKNQSWYEIYCELEESLFNSKYCTNDTNPVDVDGQVMPDDQFKNGVNLKIIRTILPEKGEWYVCVKSYSSTNGNDTYFNVNLSKINSLTDQNPFEDDEIATITTRKFIDEFNFVLWDMTSDYTSSWKTDRIINDYLSNDIFYRTKYRNIKKEFNNTNLSKHLISIIRTVGVDKFNSSVDGLFTIVRKEDIVLQLPKTTLVKKSKFKPSKIFTNFSELSSI